MVEGGALRRDLDVRAPAASHAAYAVAAFGALGTLSETPRDRKARARGDVGRPRSRTRVSAPSSGRFGMLTLPGRGDLRPRIEELAKTSGVLVGAGSFFRRAESFRLSWATCDVEKFRRGLRADRAGCAADHGFVPPDALVVSGLCSTPGARSLCAKDCLHRSRKVRRSRQGCIRDETPPLPAPRPRSGREPSRSRGRTTAFSPVFAPVS